MSSDFTQALLGGLLIGISATLMLAFNGRVTGISGLINTSLKSSSKTPLWVWSFLVGLVLGGALLITLNPELFYNTSGRSFFEIVGAGFLVGFGTVMANGCTSGHGVCGVSRLSKRSIMATLVFMISGGVTVFALRWMGWAL